jgi:hypothetical protein
MASEDEDDYMNMVIEEPPQKETFTQKKRRELREVPLSSTFHCLRLSAKTTLTFLTFYSICRLKPELESHPKPNAPLKKPPVERKLWPQALSIPPTKDLK